VKPATPSCPLPSDFRLWTPDERQASVDAALSDWREGEDVWVFGYGSLIWRPEFDFLERRKATLRGHHRALCLWSRVNRGTPETPGLVFGLDRGGSCQGMAYRVHGQAVREHFSALWQREMSTGSYLPRWLNCATDDGPVRALVFVMNRASPAYIAALPDEDVLAIVRRASGKYGPCTEYVTQTAYALKDAGIHDFKLQRLARLLEQAADPLPESM